MAERVDDKEEARGGKMVKKKEDTYNIKIICLQGIFPLPASGQSQVGVGPIWMV